MKTSTTSRKLLVVAGLGLVALGVVSLGRSRDGAPDRASSASSSSDDTSASRVSGVSRASRVFPDAKDPRLLLGRVWLDKMPKKRIDPVDIWIFFGGGIGIEDKGSVYRSAFDVFSFERRGAAADMVFLHDTAKQTIKFTIVGCPDNESFDLCADFEPPLRGQKRLYSWGSDDEMDSAVPWMREWRSSAEVRTHTVR